MPRALVGSHEGGEHAGHLHRAEDLAVGEISAVRRLLCPVWLPGGACLMRELTCLSLGVCVCVQIRVDLAFLSRDFQKE